MITDPLLFRFLSGEATGQEISQVNDWLAADQANGQYLEELRGFLENAGTERFEGDTRSAWLRLSARLDHKAPEMHRPAPARLRLILPAAAAILLLISSGLFFYLRSEARVYRNNDLTTKTLLLSDGTQVYLGPASRLVTARDFNKELREVRITRAVRVLVDSERVRRE
ncbi:MAG: hypothetical protein R6V75_09070, partial [Bacteroidales bacterium]